MGVDVSGVKAGEGLLERLVAESTAEMERRRAALPDRVVERRAAAYRPKDFAGALRREGLAVIAEMKQRTPSLGVLADDYAPELLARAYEAGGAAAVSVLTQEASFGGSLDHLEMARLSTRLPILRKDFITHPRQVLEARAAGADAVLLIVAVLTPDLLGELMDEASACGLASVVEVHDEPEAVGAVDAGARIIGVNHRDLRTFDLDLELSHRLHHVIPRDRILVAESGIHGAADALRMREAGADAILVGELLMRSSDAAAAIRGLASA